jgi:hypothetical protein
MSRSGKIIAILILMVFTGYRISAQTDMPQVDTLQSKVQKRQSVSQSNEQKTKTQGNIQKGQGNGLQSVKRVRSGRPDMTKARGARPPLIVRPSGSGIPKGVGKPGGAGRKVGR